MSEEERKAAIGEIPRKSPGGDQSGKRDLKLASDHCGCGSHCFCFK